MQAALLARLYGGNMQEKVTIRQNVILEKINSEWQIHAPKVKQ